MIDVHNHLIPNIDDGSDSLSLSRKLLEDAIDEGITDVCITPHFMKHGPFKVRKKELCTLFEQFKKDTEDLNVNLYLGNELYIDRELDELLAADEICSMNGTDYVLIEFPFEQYRREYDEYLYNVSLNYKIIIAHPERYSYVKEDHDFVDRWLKEGYILQSNSTSLNSKESKKVIFDFIEKGKLSIIASDAHNKYRPLSLKDAYDLISKKFSKETADLLMETNPRRIIENKDVYRIPKIKKRFFWN
nr:hypothetical protein [Clostridia bacterium]